MRSGTRVAVVLLASLSTLARAGDRSGTVTGQFLKMPVSPRAIGMGGVDVAVAEGVASIPFNPAGILSVQQYSAYASYTSWFADIKHSFAGAVANLHDLGTVGVGVIALSTDDMPVTTPAFPEGTGEFFRASDYAFNLAYAREVSDKFSVGVNLKYIQSYLYNTTYGASSFAVDAGTLYDIPPLGARLGVAISNLGNDMKFINETYSLPTALRFGVLLNVLDGSTNKVHGAFQVIRPNDANEQYNAGLEYLFRDQFAVRVGYKFNYDSENWTAGFGLSLAVVGINGKLNYGYNNFTYLTGTHSVSLEVLF